MDDFLPYPIERDLPPPSQRTDHTPSVPQYTKTQPRRQRRDWPFKHMKPGDSVLIPLVEWPYALNALHARKHSTGQAYEFERYTSEVRVWCTAPARPNPTGGGRNRRWGFAKCKVGDHILCLEEEYRTGCNAMRAAERRTGFKFEHGVKNGRAVFLRVA